MKNIIIGTGASSNKTYESLYPIINQSIKSGIFSFDTAPSYHTEEVLGEIIRNCMKEYNLTRDDIYIQTKIDAWQMQKSNGKIDSFVEKVLFDMKLDYLDCLLIHWPIPEYFDATWDAFCRLKQKGIVKKIGICNLRMWNLKRLSELNYMPEVVQIERHPLRSCEKEIEFCKKHKIEFQAYSPLCKMPKKILENKELMILSKKYNKSIGQIILRWHIDTGVVPIFTSTKIERIKEYANIFDFTLSQEDITVVSSLNEDFKLYLEGMLCPGL